MSQKRELKANRSPQAMAASGRASRARPSYICPPSDGAAADSGTCDGGTPFEFDEADVWSTGVVARVPSFEMIHNSSSTMPGARKSRRPPRRADILSDLKPAAAVSLPVRIPDWSKIGDRGDGGGRVESDEEGEKDRDDRVPPHEYLARRRGASLSVHEGIGRTLKGRDLSRVRDAVWKTVGLAD